MNLDFRFTPVDRQLFAMLEKSDECAIFVWAGILCPCEECSRRRLGHRESRVRLNDFQLVAIGVATVLTIFFLTALAIKNIHDHSVAPPSNPHQVATVTAKPAGDALTIDYSTPRLPSGTPFPRRPEQFIYTDFYSTRPRPSSPPTIVMSDTTSVDASSYATETWTPVHGQSYLLVVLGQTVNGSEINTPTIKGNNMVWTLQRSQRDIYGSTAIFEFSAQANEPTPGRLELHQGAQVLNNAAWAVVEADGFR